MSLVLMGTVDLALTIGITFAILTRLVIEICFFLLTITFTPQYNC